MLTIEKILNGEEIQTELDYQCFQAKSESTGRTGTFYEFTLVAVQEDEEYTIRVMQMDDTDEIIYSAVEALIQVSDDPNALPAVASILPLVEMKEDEFKKAICEYAESIIESL